MDLMVYRRIVYVYSDIDLDANIAIEFSLIKFINNFSNFIYTGSLV